MDLLYENALKFVQKDFESKGVVTEQALWILHQVLGKVLEETLNMRKTNNVTIIRNTNKNFFVIKVEDGNLPYYLNPKLNYCPCAFFREHVLTKEYATCRHVLAGTLAIIWKNSTMVATNQDLYMHINTS